MKNLSQKIIAFVFMSLMILPFIVKAKIEYINSPTASFVTNSNATLNGTIRYTIESNKVLDTYFAYEEVAVGTRTCQSLILKTRLVRYTPPFFSNGIVYVNTSEQIIGLKDNTRYAMCSVAIETENFGLNKKTTQYSNVSYFNTLINSNNSTNPTLSTMPAGQIGNNFAVLAGNIILPKINPTSYKTSFYLFKHDNGKNYSCNTIAALTLSGNNPIYGKNGVIVELLDVNGSGNFTRQTRNLEPATTYDYCAFSQVTNNSNNKQFASNVLTFTTTGGSSGGGRQSPPNRSIIKPDLIGDVLTVPIQYTTDVEAMLVGSVGKAGSPAFAYFRFSHLKKPPIFCNDIYGSDMRSITATKTPEGQFNNNYKDGKISIGKFYGLATDLQPNTEYYYCSVVSNHASNPTEIEYGKVLKFKTRPCPTCDQTDVVTDVATNIGYDTARLRGSYFSIEDMETYFEYKVNDNITILSPVGATTKNNWVETGEKISHKANSYGKITAVIDGLEPNTLYSFRAVGTTKNPNKIYYGDILNFQTHSDPDGHGFEIEDTGGNDPGTGTGTGTHGYEIEDPDGVGDYDNDGEPNDTDDDDGIDDDEDGYDYDDETDDDIDDDGIENENDDDDGADDDGDGYDADDDDSDNDGINDENDDNDGIDSDGDGTDNDDNDSDNDGEDNANDDNDGLDTDGDGSDRDTDDHDNDGEPDSDDDNDGLDSDGDGKDSDDSDRDNDGEPDKYDDNDGFDDDGDGSDSDGKVLSKKIGQISNPPQNAIVRYHEGIEHVIYRQIKVDADLAKNYSEIENDGSESYYWNVAHQMAIDFAYVDRETGREIRVSQPDVSAYELEQVEDKLYVYESHLDKKVWRVIDVRETTTIFKNKNPFEYYFKKIKKFFGF